MAEIYYNSQTYKMPSKFLGTLIYWLKQSSLVKISEAKEANPVIIGNSYVVRHVINFYGKCKNRISNYLQISLLSRALKNVKVQFHSFPARTVSIIGITIILVNAILVIILRRQVELWRCLVLAALLFTVAFVLFYRIRKLAAKEKSALLEKNEENN